MTIFFLISSEGYFGAENMIVNLGMGLSRLGCRCVLGVFNDSRFSQSEIVDQWKQQGFQVELIPCRGRCDWRAAFHIRRFLREQNPGIVHSHGYKADMYALASVNRRERLLVATCHNWPNPILRMRLYAALDRWALRRFHRVAVISHKVSETLLRSGLAKQNVKMIANGVHLERFASATPELRAEFSPHGEVVVGFVGRLVREKGADILLRSAQAILSTGRKVRFVFVGDGDGRAELERLTRLLKIKEHVSFLGVRSDMPEIYASLDILVLPSLIEAMPMCLLEGMAAGKPVVATTVGAIPSVVSPGETGLLVPPEDEAALTNALVELFDEPEKCKRLGQNGFRRVAAEFSDIAMARRYLEMYQEVEDLRLSTSRVVPA